jgi:hypothetical protein
MTTIQASRPAWRGWVDRTLGAALLDPRVYARAAEDPSATMHAAVVVVLAGVAQGVAEDAGAAWTLVTLGGVAAGWVLWATMVHVAAGTRGAWMPLLRVLGLAHGPAILRVLIWAPGLADLVVWLWSLAAGMVGVQAALRCSLRKAVLITTLTWVALVVAALWVGRMAGQEAALRAMLREGY